jgi:chromosome segregation ATPase
METAIIIVLAFMLLISIIILIDIRFDIKGLNIKNQACAAALDKSKKENEKLKTKYQSAHDEIFERDEIIKSLNYQINKYDKCNKQIAEELIKKNNVIEDAWNVIRESEKQKYNAIGQSISAKNLCNEMANKFKSLNSELETIESQLLGKLKP